jgi:hypothetical protein
MCKEKMKAGNTICLPCDDSYFKKTLYVRGFLVMNYFPLDWQKRDPFNA